jgi:CheY-like chemotaxis protein
VKDSASNSALRPLAHELRNAIAPARNAAHVLRKRAFGDPVVANAVRAIDAALDQSLRLLDRAVDAERVMRGDVTLADDDVDVAAVVQRALDLTRTAVAERGQRVRVDCGHPAPRVRGDAARLAQVIATLVDNASRYSNDGEEIAVGIASRESEAVVRVRDRGAGIPSSFLPQVFEPFAQRDDARAPSLAMSLPVARKLVELHGGTLIASSDGAGRGSEFSIVLPRVEAADQQAVASARTAQPADANGASGRRVLFVDDNRAVRETYADALADLGLEVDTAADGEQALARALEWRPRFVVLDINLPKRNGYEVARALRERFPSDQMTLVMVSGTLLDESTLAMAREAGFDHCLDKAGDLPALERLLGG